MTGEQWDPGLAKRLAYGFAIGRTLHVQTNEVKSVRFLKTWVVLENIGEHENIALKTYVTIIVKT